MVVSAKWRQMDSRRRHKLLTVADLKKLPGMNEGPEGDERMCYVKLFTPFSDFTWYVLEFDPEHQLAYCLTYRTSFADQCPEGEYGDVYLPELAESDRAGVPMVERDCFWTPQTVGDIRAQLAKQSEPLVA